MNEWERIRILPQLIVFVMKNVSIFIVYPKIDLSESLSDIYK